MTTQTADLQPALLEPGDCKIGAEQPRVGNPTPNGSVDLDEEPLRPINWNLLTSEEAEAEWLDLNALRAELTTLLRQHRIQHRLGGKGPPTMPETTTVEERQALGELIGRYRQMVLVWCLHAIRAANPHINPEGTTGRSRGPAGELRYRLVAAIDASPAGLPTLEDLTTPQDFQMVETWRHAARAAALGEHDFGAGVGYGRLSEHQCKTVRKDAAEIARALVGLDRRYANIPGWQPLKDQGRLGRAAEVCAAHAGNDAPDYSVDVRGWQPPLQLDTRPAPPGVDGILQGREEPARRVEAVPRPTNPAPDPRLPADRLPPTVVPRAQDPQHARRQVGEAPRDLRNAARRDP